MCVSHTLHTVRKTRPLFWYFISRITVTQQEQRHCQNDTVGCNFFLSFHCFLFRVWAIKLKRLNVIRRTDRSITLFNWWYKQNRRFVTCPNYVIKVRIMIHSSRSFVWVPPFPANKIEIIYRILWIFGWKSTRRGKPYTSFLLYCWKRKGTDCEKTQLLPDCITSNDTD